MAALQGALALPEVTDRSRAVADDLHLDVPRPEQVALDVEVAVAERRLRLGAAALEGVLERRGVRHHAHAAAAAAGDRLQTIIAPAPSAARNSRASATVVGRDVPGRTGTPQRSASARARPCRRRARAAPRAARRSGSPPRRSAREGRVLREEAVAGMDRVAAGLARHGDDLLDVEVGGGAASPQRPRLVGPADVQATRVVLGEDRDGAHAEVGRRPQDADGDLAAVRDQKALRTAQRLYSSELP